MHRPVVCIGRIHIVCIASSEEAVVSHNVTVHSWFIYPGAHDLLRILAYPAAMASPKPRKLKPCILTQESGEDPSVPVKPTNLFCTMSPACF